MKDNPFSQLVNVYLSSSDIHSVFGVILYTDENPYIKKVLRDHDYWLALDCVSGPKWPVFAIRPSRGKYVDHKHRLGPGERGMMVDMVSEWKEPIENSDILQFLGLEDLRSSPMLIVFCRGTNDEVLSMKYKIDEKNEERCYDSIKCGFKAVAQSIKRVSPENIQNTVEVYNLMESGLKTELFWSRVKKIPSWIEFLNVLKP